MGACLGRRTPPRGADGQCGGLGEASRSEELLQKGTVFTHCLPDGTGLTHKTRVGHHLESYTRAVEGRCTLYRQTSNVNGTRYKSRLLLDQNVGAPNSEINATRFFVQSC